MEPGENRMLRKLIRETIESETNRLVYTNKKFDAAHNSLMDIRWIIDQYSNKLQTLFSVNYKNHN